MGRLMEDGTLECPVHGWRAHGNGRFREPCGVLRRGSTWAPHAPLRAVEHDGIVWVAPDDAEPRAAPPDVPGLRDPGLRFCGFETVLRAPAQVVLENGIDPAHAGWVHANPLGFGWYQRMPEGLAETRGGRGIVFRYAPRGPLVALLGYGDTRNEHAFELPYTTWSEVGADSVRAGALRLVTFVTLLPEGPTSTRMFVLFGRSFARAAALDGAMLAMGKEIVRQDALQLEAMDHDVACAGMDAYGGADALVARYRLELGALRFR
jgi:phenylpropionate dioxygenase-like ring-hydroxylating dioxygenase large terminal subunit